MSRDLAVPCADPVARQARQTEPSSTSRPARVPSLTVLMLLIGISPLATDMYLAALPAMGSSLGSSAATMQLTLTGFLVGLAAGQLVIGPISDGIGRRPFLIGGTAAFLLLSLVCAIAPNGPVLVTVRVAQGFASAAGIVCGRAVISDYSTGQTADRRFAIVTSASLVGPVVAPALGGVILSVASWRGIFLVLTAVGALMLAGVLLRVPETLMPSRRDATGLRASLGRMSELARLPIFRAHVVTGMATIAGFFTYIGGSAFVLQGSYGISETTYTLVFASNGLAMVLVSVAAIALLPRVGAIVLRRAGLALTVTASAFILVTGLLGTDHFGSTWAALCCVTAGMGLVLPASIALGQRAGAAYAGTASALQGGFQFGCGALVIPLTGLIGFTSVVPMAALMTGFMALAALLSLRAPDPARAGAPSRG